MGQLFLRDSLAHLERLATEQTARYLLASLVFNNRAAREPEISVGDFSKTHNLHAKTLTQWLDYFGLRDYTPCASLFRNDDAIPGLHRWSSGANHFPAVQVNVRDELVERKGVKFPPRSVGLTPSKTSGIVLSWTSPFTGTARLTGRVSDAKASGSKGFAAALDLRTQAGRRELASFNLAGGGAIEFERLPDRDRLANVTVRTGDTIGGKFRGDLAELRVYAQPLEDAARAQVEKELFDSWINPDAPEAAPLPAIALLYDELCSPRGPFWLDHDEREHVMGSHLTQRINQTRVELETLKKSFPTNVPQAVVVQDGGPAKTKHEGFKDAQIYLRGNPKTPGKTVPRGLPKGLAGDDQPPITEGSGRLRLSE